MKLSINWNEKKNRILDIFWMSSKFFLRFSVWSDDSLSCADIIPHPQNPAARVISKIIFFKKPFPLVNYELLSLSAESCFTCIVSTNFFSFFLFYFPSKLDILLYIFFLATRYDNFWSHGSERERERQERGGEFDEWAGECSFVWYQLQNSNIDILQKIEWIILFDRFPKVVVTQYV